MVVSSLRKTFTFLRKKKTRKQQGQTLQIVVDVEDFAFLFFCFAFFIGVFFVISCFLVSLLFLLFSCVFVCFSFLFFCLFFFYVFFFVLLFSFVFIFFYSFFFFSFFFFPTPERTNRRNLPVVKITISFVKIRFLGLSGQGMLGMTHFEGNPRFHFFHFVHFFLLSGSFFFLRKNLPFKHFFIATISVGI